MDWMYTRGQYLQARFIQKNWIDNWVLENMNNPYIPICDLIESKMNVIIHKINQLDDLIEADPLDSQLSILEWIFYQVCSNEIKRIESIWFWIKKFMN